MKELVIYHCPTCGNIINMIEDSGVVPVCCGTDMKRLTANTTDGATEKHVPVIKHTGKTIHVTVGEEPHPMQDDHSIKWIALLTEHDLCIHFLEEGCRAETEFRICKDEKVISVYAYCNLHGLWKCDSCD